VLVNFYHNAHHTNMFSFFVDMLYNFYFSLKVFYNVYSSFVNSLGLYKNVKYYKLFINCHGPQIRAP
jgi:hypothetical protein